MQRRKPMDMAFEDDVWALFARMGFSFLNKDRNFRLPYSNDEKLTQQIDIFVADEETILIIECKVAGNPKQSNFKETIEAIGGKKEGLITTIQQLFPDTGINIYNFEDASELLNKLQVENYDVIINSNSHIMSLLAAFVDDKTRLITVSHSLGTMDCDNAAFNNEYIDNIIALSSSCKDYISHRFGIKNNDKIKVVFNSVADNPEAEAMKKSKMAADKVKIVFAGGSAASKSPDLVVPIVHKLCKTDLPFEFYWLGITTPPLKKFQPFDDIRQVLPEDERVIVAGLIPQQKAAEIIASCNVFLAPSRREGFPMALLEAMRIGCIPVVSDFKIANQEIIRNGINGYVIPHKDVKAFVDRLSDIVKNHENYKRVYEESYKTFIEELSFPVWRKHIHSVIIENSATHKQRTAITKSAFRKVVWRFKMLDKCNLIENHMKEVLPCAIKFYMYYTKLN